MYTHQNRQAVSDRDSNLATSHWEARTFLAESVFDPSYERANAALRRWVEGMEAALGTAAHGKREVA